MRSIEKPERGEAEEGDRYKSTYNDKKPLFINVLLMFILFFEIFQVIYVIIFFNKYIYFLIYTLRKNFRSFMSYKVKYEQVRFRFCGYLINFNPRGQIIRICFNSRIIIFNFFYFCPKFSTSIYSRRINQKRVYSYP